MLEGLRKLDLPEEELHTHKKGLRLLHTQKVPILDSQGNPEYILGISQDITDRKQAELQKTKGELLLTLMLNTGPSCIKRVAADGALLSMNSAGLELIEASSEVEALGLSVFALVLPEHRHAFEQMHQQVLGGSPQTLQFEIQGFKGTRRWMETYAVPFKNPITGQTEQLAVTHDITERKAAEAAFRISEHSIRTLYEVTSSRNLTFEQKIRALLELGCRRLELPGGALTKQVNNFLELEFLHAPEHTWAEHTLLPIGDSFCGQVLKQEEPLVFEQGGKSMWNSHPAYKTLGLEAYIGTKVMVGEAIYGSLCFFDQTPHPKNFTSADQDFLNLMARWIGSELERQHAEKVIQDNERRFRMVCEAIPQQVWTAQPDGTLDYVNQRMLDFFQIPFESLIQQGWHDIIHPDDLPIYLERWEQSRKTDQPHEIEFRLKRGSDQAYRTHISRALPVCNQEGHVMKWFGTNTDITELKHMADQLRQSQKMEAIGTLAGGIAHDFNNVLGVILGFAELAQHRAHGNTGLEKNLQEITIAGKRAKALVHHILTFGRQEEVVRNPLDVNFHIQDVLNMVRATLPSTIDIQTKLSNEPVSILGDLTQLQQVVLNLCSNAEHAMREKGGTLEIGTESLEFHKATPFEQLTIEPGRYIRLWVKDTGDGIPQHLLDRIFDPFFTTKEVGKGTGMGLAVIHGIVTTHQGAIAVHSTLGQGTKFDIYFPAHEFKNVPQGTSEPPVLALKKTARVLFVDDEMPLAYFGKETLETLGCDVDICTNGLDALECFQKDLSRYDVVISDQTMPGMTGETLAQRLLNLKKNLPIVLCTGFSHTITPHMAEQTGIKAYLKKPVLKEDLIQTLNNIL